MENKHLKKLSQIAEGYTNLTLSALSLTSEQIEKVSEVRIKVCEKCPNNINNSCALCGCYLPSKTRVRSAKCPANLW